VKIKQQLFVPKLIDIGPDVFKLFESITVVQFFEQQHKNSKQKRQTHTDFNISFTIAFRDKQ